MDNCSGLGRFSPKEWGGWTMTSELDGTTADTVSCVCILISPDGDGAWTESGIRTTGAHADAVVRLADRARRDGFTPPDAQPMLNLIDKYPLEPQLCEMLASFLAY